MLSYHSVNGQFPIEFCVYLLPWYESLYGGGSSGWWWLMLFVFFHRHKVVSSLSTPYSHRFEFSRSASPSPIHTPQSLELNKGIIISLMT